MNRIFLIFTIFICCSCSSRYITFLDFGPIQVVGSDEEVWLFLEFEQMVYRSNAASDTPKVVPIGRVQEVIVLDKNGLKKQFKISIDNGRTFHPNLSYIFRWLDQFYLYQGQSAFYKRSLYKWKDDHFELLPLVESEAFFTKNVFKNKLEEKMTVTEIESALANLSSDEGWKNIYSRRSCRNGTFKWNNMDIKISGLDVEKTGKIKLNINASYGGNSFSAILEHNKGYKEISADGYEKLRSQERQKGHKK